MANSAIPLEIKWIRQEDYHGCGAAALAMVTGKTYKEVTEAFNHDFKTEGITQFELDDYLTANGYAVARKWSFDNAAKQKRAKTWKRWRPEPFGPIHICAVATVGGGHYVVMLSDGTILDPAFEQRKKIDDGIYVYVNWIAAIIPF